MGAKKVEEYDWGLYVWVVNGKFVADDDFNLMNVAAKRGDTRAIEMLEKAARYYGIEGGRAEFLGGHRRITDEQFEEQKARLRAGLTADPFDVKAAEDELKYDRRFHG